MANIHLPVMLNYWREPEKHFFALAYIFWTKQSREKIEAPECQKPYEKGTKYNHKKYSALFNF